MSLTPRIRLKTEMLLKHTKRRTIRARSLRENRGEKTGERKQGRGGKQGIHRSSVHDTRELPKTAEHQTREPRRP